jgi:hypothetical protein
MSKILRTAFKNHKVCLHRILEARVITADKAPCKLKIKYNTMPYIVTVYRIDNNMKHIPYDKVDFDMKKTTLDYPKINSTFIDDIKFLMDWGVNIVSDTDTQIDIGKMLIINNSIDACRLVC